MSGELSHALATHLRALREAHDLTQEKFALHYGIGRTWQGVLERGERNVTFETVEKIAAKIGVSPFYFTRPVGPTGPIPDLSRWPQRDDEAAEAATQPGFRDVSRGQ